MYLIFRFMCSRNFDVKSQTQLYAILSQTLYTVCYYIELCVTVCMLNSVVRCFISNSACYFKSVICYWCPWLYVAWSVTPNYVCRYEIMLLYFKSDQSMLDQSVGSMFWTKLPITDRFQYISVWFCSFPNNRICPVHFRFRHFNFRFHLIKKIWKWKWDRCFFDHPFSETI
jgi:hypothetical protein